MNPAEKQALCLRLAAIGLPQTGVTFRSDDRALEALMAKAEAKAAANIVRFSPAMEALIEGGGYSSVYTETQPMGGEMYAKRNPRVAAPSGSCASRSGCWCGRRRASYKKET